jgi:hypothetical protein
MPLIQPDHPRITIYHAQRHGYQSRGVMLDNTVIEESLITPNYGFSWGALRWSNTNFHK